VTRRYRPHQPNLPERAQSIEVLRVVDEGGNGRPRCRPLGSMLTKDGCLRFHSGKGQHPMIRGKVRRCNGFHIRYCLAIARAFAARARTWTLNGFGDPEAIEQQRRSIEETFAVSQPIRAPM